MKVTGWARVPLTGVDAMGLHKVARLQGQSLERFAEMMNVINESNDTPVFNLDLYVDEDGVKVRVNGGVWSAPMGQVTKRL